jgi:hypothetical protein
VEVALDRDALYYPYIHVRDVNWLKATLLCFPQVRRIVPKDFSLNDLPEVRPFLEVTGARGEPLVAAEPAYHYSAAQERLSARLQDALRRSAVEIHPCTEHRGVRTCGRLISGPRRQDATCSISEETTWR